MISETQATPNDAAPRPATRLRNEFVWIDIEASSLSNVSYPIEVGWAFDDLQAEACLIRPHDAWTEWSGQSQELHGITREELMDRGVPVTEVAERLNDTLGGLAVFTDTTDETGNRGMDAFWLRRMYVAANTRISFRLIDQNAAIGQQLKLTSKADVDRVLPRLALAEDLASRSYPAIHRAEPDAINMAASFRLTVDDEFLETVRQFDAEVLARRSFRP